MSGWQDVGSAAELAEAGRLVARIGGREVGILADGDCVHAIRNRCPHHGGPLALGRVRERETGRPGAYEPTGKRVLRCPWHGWEFDLETGRCLDDPKFRAAVYEAKIEDGRVIVSA